MSRRAALADLYEAGVAGADPGPLTAAALADFAARPGQRIWLYAFGKGARAMATSAVATLHSSRHSVCGGVIVAPEAGLSPCATLVSLAGDHPQPGRRSFAAAEKIGMVASGMRGDDVVVVLVSGGASSLIAAPIRGLSESALTQLFDLLLGSGLDVREVNAVRKRFTRWGAGRLALALAPARTHVFVISDVPGDDPADVGSGCCTPDPNRVRDVCELMRRSGVLARVSPALREYLAGVERGVIPETPKRTHPAFAHVSTRVIGSNALALDAIVAHATARGLAMQRAATSVSGDAATAGEMIATALLERAASGALGGTVWGGETTVRLSVAATPGAAPAGGRCQELALAASRVLASAGDAGRRVTLLAAGTDGRDGPTDASGAYADAGVWSAIIAAGRDPGLDLVRHDSHAALHAAGALLRRGLTGTNVMDVVIGVVS